MNGFRTIWETLNSGSNLIGLAVLCLGAGLASHGHDTAGTGLIGIGATLLTNGTKKDQHTSSGAPQA